MINKFYDDEYLAHMLSDLNNAIDGLSSWSAHNNDVGNNLIYRLGELAEKLDEELE